jgi:hypothetical protein
MGSMLPKNLEPMLSLYCLKGHDNEADFLRFLHKSVRHWSLTLHFKPFWYWLQICGDIHNWKTTPQLGESGSRQLSDLANRVVADLPTRRVGESTTPRLGKSESRLLNVKTSLFGESESCRLPESRSQRVGDSMTHQVRESGSLYLPDSASRRVTMVSWGVAIQKFKFIIDLQNFKQLNQSFNGPTLQKISQGCNILSLLIYLKVWNKGQL